MKQFYLSLALAFPALLNAQYCTNGGPSSTADSQVMFVRLVGQNDSIRYNYTCPGTIGVQNLTNLSTSLVAGSNYQLSVQFGTCNGNYAGAGEAWIDYDQSGTFDPNESIGTWQGLPPVALSVWSFNVPLMSQNGATRMRVTQQEAGSVPLDPCAAFQWGSVMDFTINISGGVDCSAYPGDERSDAIPVTTMPYTHSWSTSYCYSNQNYVYPSPDIYYLVLPTVQTAFINATLCGSSYDTYISAIDPQGNVLAYNDDNPNCAPYSSISIPAAGQDSIYIIVEGWGANAGSYILNITQGIVGVEEVASPEIKLYPNPADNGFVIQNVSNASVTLYDVAGKSVMSIADYSGENIETAELAEGVYTVECISQGKTSVQKLVIAR
ncbi:MAG: T9SS type A sorting domain-containing protein [Bacteroidia bacterium]|nr:T9SS type A sorting domain-containing protein [Bacteroidia bacterium]